MWNLPIFIYNIFFEKYESIILIDYWSHILTINKKIKLITKFISFFWLDKNVLQIKITIQRSVIGQEEACSPFFYINHFFIPKPILTIFEYVIKQNKLNVF